MKLLFVLLSVFFLTTPDILHKDRILELDSQGNIIGLPEEFSPAKFNFEKKELQIKNKTVVFPKCLHSFFGKHKSNLRYLSASWYHSKKNMPYYLNFEIWENHNSYQILIDLETLELLKINKQTSTDDSLISKKIELRQNCLDAYQNSIRIIY